MAWQYVLLGTQTDSVSTTWPSDAELALTDAEEPEDLRWNQDDWAGISRDPIPIGEILNPRERTLSLALGEQGLASATLDYNDPMVPEIEERNADVLVKIYEDWNLRAVMDCVGTETIGNEQGLAMKMTFADPLFRLEHRLCRRTGPGGVLTAAQPHVTWSGIDPGVIITELLFNANNELLDIQPGVADTGIRMGVVEVIQHVPAIGQPPVPTLMTVGADPAWNYKPMAEALQEMASSGVSAERIGAFDFQLRPFEPVVDGPRLKIAELDVKNRVGTERPNVVFEFGDASHSASGFRLIRDRKDITNRAFAQGADPLDDTQTKRGFHGASQHARGLFERLTPIDVGSPELRQAWVDAVTQIRGDAFLRAEFKPSSHSPQFGMDPDGGDGEYTIGDSIRVRVRVGGVDHFDAMMRMYGIDLTIDNQGREDLTPKLAIE